MKGHVRLIWGQAKSLRIQPPPADPLGDAGFAAYGGFESNYSIMARAWRVQGGGRGAVEQLNVTGPGEVSSLEWRYRPASAGEFVPGAACFQGTLFRGCVDSSPSGQWRDAQGRNCSTVRNPRPLYGRLVVWLAPGAGFAPNFKP